MIEASGIDHIVLHVGDVRSSKDFYTGRLGMTVYRENDHQVFLHAGTQGSRYSSGWKALRLRAAISTTWRSTSPAAPMRASRPNSKRTASRSAAARATIIASISRTPTATACN